MHPKETVRLWFPRMYSLKSAAALLEWVVISIDCTTNPVCGMFIPPLLAIASGTSPSRQNGIATGPNNINRKSDRLSISIDAIITETSHPWDAASP